MSVRGRLEQRVKREEEERWRVLWENNDNDNSGAFPWARHWAMCQTPSPHHSSNLVLELPRLQLRKLLLGEVNSASHTLTDFLSVLWVSWMLRHLCLLCHLLIDPCSLHVLLQGEQILEIQQPEAESRARLPQVSPAGLDGLPFGGPAGCGDRGGNGGDHHRGGRGRQWGSERSRCGAACAAAAAGAGSGPRSLLLQTPRDPQATALLPAVPAGQGLTPITARPLLPRGLGL